MKSVIVGLLLAVVHIFRSTSGLHGATADPSGAALPEDLTGGGWRHVRDVQLEDGEQRVAIDSGLALADIRERGYHLMAGWYARV